MSNIRVERILTEVPSFTAEERIQIAEAMLASPAAKPVKIDNVTTSAAVDPAYLARVQACGEAKRLNLKISEVQGGKLVVDVNELNAALAASGKDPQSRMGIKKIMSLGGLIP